MAINKENDLLTSRTYSKANFQLWQQHFHHIFGKVNSRRTAVEIWGRVMENMSGMAMLIRNEEYGGAFIRLSHMFCWLCAAATKTEIVLDNILWQKFPYVCPYCELPTCICSTKKSKLARRKIREDVLIKRLREYGTNNLNNKPESLRKWVIMIESIYGDRVHMLPIEAIVFHLSEETGEAAESLRKIRSYSTKREVDRNISSTGKLTNRNVKRYEYLERLSLELEISDVLSLMLSLALKLQYIALAINKYQVLKISVGTGTNKIDVRVPIEALSLSKVIYEEYGNGCHICGNYICNCPKNILP